jgi:hypothetical protein
LGWGPGTLEHIVDQVDGVADIGHTVAVSLPIANRGWKNLIVVNSRVFGANKNPAPVIGERGDA